MRVIKPRPSTESANADRGEFISDVASVLVTDTSVNVRRLSGVTERFTVTSGDADTFIQAWVNTMATVVVAELVFSDRALV